MPRDILVHPSNPIWRLRLHPTSRIFPQTWSTDERDAHPIWTHDLVDMCQLKTPAGNSFDSHQCDDLYPPMAVTEATIFDKIAYFHGSKHWDAHWQSIPDFSLHPDLAHVLNPTQTALVGKHLRQIGEYYAVMDAAGFFSKTADFLTSVFRSTHPDRPPNPTSVFGAGFSGFDRIDERGSYQIAYFITLGRIFQIPAGHLVAYDPCYSLVDVILLATLGVRALRRGDPGLKRLRKFTNPTLFYAPGAEQSVFTDAIQRADPIEHLVILGGDAEWCGRGTAHFTASYGCMHAPGYVTAYNGESPCGEDNCLQWIPRSRIEAFNRARGPASEPGVRQMLMPDGSLQPDD
ncbi:hypothetical protein B0H13DRAFT_1977431 [Mycena leptocephala]|nr:hypothetical protein B0H13DRAFT_1977431 [Mycena leptocephala]